MNLKDIVRPNIWNLKPYSSARSEFKGEASVWLDANENPLNQPYNRYPDPLQMQVKSAIARLKGVAEENIFLGVGSDECIDMVYRTFCRPGVDNVVAISPSYGMYEVCADINDVAYRKVALGSDFSLDADTLIAAVDSNTRAIWICSPNNPTGNAFDSSMLADICRRADNCIVVIDEAYIDFSAQPTMLRQLVNLPNLIVLQTFSKAWGSAAVRLGMAFASREIIDIFNKVKYPYNVNKLTQDYALKLLGCQSQVRDWVAMLLQQRSALIARLQQLPVVKHIYATDANFVLVRVSDACDIYQYLCRRGIIVRNRHRVQLCEQCLRITVGTQDENDTLIKALEEYGK